MEMDAMVWQLREIISVLYTTKTFLRSGYYRISEYGFCHERCMRKNSAKGYQPFTTGFNEWWVFKHIWQHFLDAAAKDAGLSTSDLIAKFEKGEAKVSDYPELYNNYFDFIDWL